MFKKLMAICTLVVALMSAQDSLAAAAPPPAVDTDAGVQTAPVRIDGVVLFFVRGITAHPARDRAAIIAARITALAGDPAFKVDSLVTVEAEHSTDIVADGRLIVSIHDVDAEMDNIPRKVLAQVYVAKIRATIESYRRDRGTHSLARGAATAAGALLALAALIMLIRWGYRRLLALVEARFTSKIRELQAKSHDIVRTEWIWTFLQGILRTVRTLLILLAVFFYIDLALNLFPWTRSFAIPLLELVITPLRRIGISVLEYLPNLAFLIVLFFVARYVLHILQAFFRGIERGRIRFSGFETEWAIPMYKIARLAVIAFTVVVAYPYIPGSESPAFKGVSLFLGIVFSLGSSSSISNVMAGYMVIYRRVFKVGDRVKIGERMGDVTEMRLQVTHLRTVKNEEIIVPNSLIVNTEVVNYSSLSRKGGLILHTTVTIGYDTPWRQVHAMLLEAADRTPKLLKDPKPFVLQTGLNDFYVGYELNAYTERPLEMAKTYSHLHQSIQDVFNEYGVQIMSPNYVADPAQAKIVPKEQWYQAPAKPDQPAERSGEDNKHL